MSSFNFKNGLFKKLLFWGGAFVIAGSFLVLHYQTPVWSVVLAGALTLFYTLYSHYRS